MEVINSLSNYLNSNIRVLRKRFSYSQEELGKKIGLNRGNIASYENGSAEPKICNLLKLSILFRISILDLTQKDLRDEKVYEEATSFFQRSSDSDKSLFEAYAKKISSLERFIDGIDNCQCFKVDALSEIPSELEFAFYHYNQLLEATKELIKMNKDIVEVIHCKL